MTQEEVTKHITVAYDSVNLIAALDELTPPLSDEDTATRIRNVEHLRIMMNIAEFAAGLTGPQTIEINALIA